MNMAGKRLPGGRGFTLVEILVALTLFSLVLAIIFSALYSSGRTWERSEAQIADNDSRRLDLGFVRKQLGEAIPLVLLDGRDNPVLFAGDHDAVRFIADLPGHRGGGGLYVLSLAIVQNDNNKDLVLSYRPVTPEVDLDNPENPDAVKKITILEDIDSLEFSYFGSKDGKTDPAWSDDWREKQQIPELVRMHLESARADKYFPDMTVNLHMGNVRGQPQLTLYKDRNPGVGDAGNG